MPLKLTNAEGVQMEIVTPSQAKKELGLFERVLRISVPQPEDKPTIVLDMGLSIADTQDLLHMLSTT